MLEVNPDKTFSLILKPDTEADEAKCPTFHFKTLTARQYAQVDEHFRKSREAIKSDAELSHLKDGFKIVMVGWDNVKNSHGKTAPFDIDEIDDCCSMAELMLLRGNLLNEQTINELDKKKAASPWPSLSVISAKSKTADAPNAQTK